MAAGYMTDGTRIITVEEFDRMFDEGEDYFPFLDIPKLNSPAEHAELKP